MACAIPRCSGQDCSTCGSALLNPSVREIMNPRPPVVGCDANLMQVAQLLCEENRRRVAVEREGRIVGVVREQELFHEISRLILSRG